MTDIQEKEFEHRFSVGRIGWTTPINLQKEFRDFLRTAIEIAIKNREREIAMEVEEMRKEPSYTDYEHEAYNQTLDKILSIINTPR